MSKDDGDNSIYGVYASDRFECAAGMSLTGEQWAYANYEDEDFKVIFVKEPPTSNLKRYVYELPKEYFVETASKHQFVCRGQVPILKVHEFFTEDLGRYWRMATQTEKAMAIKRLKDYHPK